MEANCKLAIQGTLTLSSTSPAGATISKISGGITVSGSAISGRNTSTAPFVESNHSSGSVQVTGTVSVITFSKTVLLSRQGSTCSYSNSDMLMFAQERLNATFSYSEDMGDGPSSYDESSAASHVIGDLMMGSATVSAEAAATLNSSTSAITSSPISGAAASSDNDDAISGSPTAATIERDYSLTVPISGASQAGQVCGYLDMNANGVYSTSSPNERACTSFAIGATSATLNWTAAQWPSGASAVTSTGLRLRAAYGSGASSPTGPVDSGEVEDYLVQLLSPTPPAAVPLSGTATQNANQTVTPATSQGSMDAARTCIVSGASCVNSLTVSGEGTYTVNGNGTITFDPLPSFIGVASQITYRIEDSGGQQSTSTISLEVVAAPTAQNDSTTTPYNTAVTSNVVLNDSAAASTTLSASTLKLCASGETPPNCTASSVEIAGKGTFSRHPTSGEITFTPLSTFTGDTSIDYQIADALGGVDSATLTVTVSTPSGPSALPKESNGPTDTNQSITLNGSGGGATLDPTQTCIVSGASCVRTLTVAGEGTYTVNVDGTVTFDPVSGFTGTASHTYRVYDVVGQSAEATLTVSVAGLPVLNDDLSSGAYNTDQVIDVLDNDAADSPATLDPSSVRICAVSTADVSCTSTSLTIPGEGTYTVNVDGSVTFNPLPSFAGDASTIKYVVEDSFGQQSSAVINAQVAYPEPSVARSDTSEGISGALQTIDPLGNDTSPAGVSLVATTVRLCGTGQVSPNCTATSLVVVGEGTYTVDTTTGIVSFQPEPGFAGSAQQLNYVVADSLARVITSSVTTSVVGPPTIVDDSSSGAYNTDQVIDVLDNDAADSPATLDPSSVRICTVSTADASCSSTSLTIPGEGTYTVNADGTVTFDPLPSFAGNASTIRYVVMDSAGQSDSGTISISVDHPSAPEAEAESKPLLPGQAVTFSSVTSELGSGEGIIIGAVAGGPCIIDPSDMVCKTMFAIEGEGTWSIDQVTGRATFTANPNAIQGQQTPVTYIITDAVGQVASATLTPAIIGPPSANPDRKSTPWNRATSVSILGNDEHDPDVSWDLNSVFLCGLDPVETAPNCTKRNLIVPGEGTYTVRSDGTVSFRPDRNFFGVATTVSYQVADELGQVVHTSLAISVSEPPVATPGSEVIEVEPEATGEFSEIEGDGGLIISPKNAPSLLPESLCIVHPRTGVCGRDSVVVPGYGTYFIDPESGQIMFRAFSNAPMGDVPEIEYQINDEIGRMYSGSVGAVVVGKSIEELPATGGNATPVALFAFLCMLLGYGVRNFRRA
jgi:CshA-type fibril repeat protein